jgi:4-diphosphocytidyl-2-C-methyl-D-erythritol kinase
MLATRRADTVVVRAPAKVNLFLEVIAKRPDGYHDLITFMVAVGLFDVLEFREEPGGAVRLTCDDPSLSVGEDNLVWRAADVFRRRTGIARGVHIHLRKRIPLAAGLGGGSSDAAATLKGLNWLWQADRSAGELAELGAALGSDVPFFFALPAAWCMGRGERVEPYPLRRPLNVVLACPPAGLSTAAVYRGVTVPANPVTPEPLRRALEDGRAEAIGRELFNRLQPVAEGLCPEVAALRRLFATIAPAGHALSGSGSAYFALARTRRDAHRLARLVRREYDGPGLRVVVTRTIPTEVLGTEY